MTNADIPARLTILTSKDHSRAEEFVVRAFEGVFDEADIWIELAGIDPSICYALRQGQEIAGLYLVEPRSMLPQIGPFSMLNSCAGLKDVALVVAPELRGRGYGRLLRSAMSELAARRGYDYLWGKSCDVPGQGHSDGARILVREHATWRTTVEPLTSDLKEKLAPYSSPQLSRRWSGQQQRLPKSIEGLLVIEKTRDGILLPWIVGTDEVYSLPPCTPRDEATLKLEGQRVATVAVLDGNRTEGAQLDLAPINTEDEEVVLILR